MNTVGVRALVRRILLAVFLLSLLGGAGGFYLILRDEAMNDAEKEARGLLAFAVSVRDYTGNHITPKLMSRSGGEFFEEEVPFFASRTVFLSAGGKAREYSFRQPTVNPTSPEDEPTAFEMGVIERFRKNGALKELTGVQTTDSAQLFYLAEPVRVTDEACLSCHSTPDRAPQAMVAKYGPYRGFGWKLGDIVGAEILSVPLSQQLKDVLGLVGILAGGLLVVFALAYFALSAALDRLLIQPLDFLTSAADRASKSATSPFTPPQSSVREVYDLGGAIGRLRQSLVSALKELDNPEYRRGSAP